jgi:hypothetical protein
MPPNADFGHNKPNEPDGKPNDPGGASPYPPKEEEEEQADREAWRHSLEDLMMAAE